MVEASAVDLVGAVREVLSGSPEPLTLPRIRRALPMPLQMISAETLAQVLRRQTAAQVVVLYPKYRSRQDRYWDRPVRLHLEQLLRRVLRRGPLAWSAIRRHLPGYAKIAAESILEEQVARGRIYRHPRVGRLGIRYSLTPAEPRLYVQTELATLFGRLEDLGFARRQVRRSILELLREDEVRETPRSTTPPRPMPRRASPYRAGRNVGYVTPGVVFAEPPGSRLAAVTSS